MTDLPKRKARKLWRILYKPDFEDRAFTFSIIAVKRTAYVALAIGNINSLHFQNPQHKARLYCDEGCFNEAHKLTHRLDYPEMVDVIPFWGVLGEDCPWQFCETDVLKAMKGREDVVFVDADTTWLRDPDFDADKIVFYHLERTFRLEEWESALIKHLFDGNEGHLDYGHYNTSFLALPKRFHTDGFLRDWRSLTEQIVWLDDLDSVDERGLRHLNRLGEQIGASLAAQIHFGRDDITTLQEEHCSRKDRVLESYYYGARYGIWS